MSRVINKMSTLLKSAEVIETKRLGRTIWRVICGSEYVSRRVKDARRRGTGHFWGLEDVRLRDTGKHNTLHTIVSTYICGLFEYMGKKEPGIVSP